MNKRQINQVVRTARTVFGVPNMSGRRERVTWARFAVTHYLRNNGCSVSQLSAQLPWHPAHNTIYDALQRHQELRVGARGYQQLCAELYLSLSVFLPS